MSRFLSILSQRRSIGRLVLGFVTNPIPSTIWSFRMGFCSNFVEAVRDGAAKCRDSATRMGVSVAKRFEGCCVCSDCLPSSDAVGSCLGRVFFFFAVVVCCPCACCWCICRAIHFFKRRGQDPDSRIIEEDADGNRGYNTFHDDVVHEKEYHDHYGGAKVENKNYMFYTNQLASEPNGDFIDNILVKWHGNYDFLEDHHGFIQWLFPLPEAGVNWRAQVLNEAEREQIMNDERARQRMLNAYKMMLDFYGIVLKDVETGEVERSAKYQDRFRNLNRNRHNCLRISRIMRCMMLFDYDYLVKPLLKFFVEEIFKERNLLNCRDSCLNYWIPLLRKEEADELEKYALTLESDFAQDSDD